MPTQEQQDTHPSTSPTTSSSSSSFPNDPNLPSSSIKCPLCMCCLTPDDAPSLTGSMSGDTRAAGLIEELGSEELGPGLRRVLSVEEENIVCGRCNESRARNAMENSLVEGERSRENSKSRSRSRQGGRRHVNTEVSLLHSSTQPHLHSISSTSGLLLPEEKDLPQHQEELGSISASDFDSPNPSSPRPIPIDRSTTNASITESNDLSTSSASSTSTFSASVTSTGEVIAPTTHDAPHQSDQRGRRDTRQRCHYNHPYISQREVSDGLSDTSTQPSDTYRLTNATSTTAGTSGTSTPRRMELEGGDVLMGLTSLENVSGLRTGGGRSTMECPTLTVSGSSRTIRTSVSDDGNSNGLGLGLGLGLNGLESLETLVLTPPQSRIEYSSDLTSSIRIEGEDSALDTTDSIYSPRHPLQPCFKHLPPIANTRTRPPISIPTTSSASVNPGIISTRPERAPNPYLDLDIGRRVSSKGRGTLYPGSLFKGTQTSGRSSYEVEVRIVDVSFPDSTVSGYLSICHLTDSHPLLTTFFTGEIIGSKYGFLTGPNYYARATEQDDMRHWSRFEHFRKVRNELKRPDLTMRDDVVSGGFSGGGGSSAGGAGSNGRGSLSGGERSFAFMRWKERFLVPDHRVRDINGASFAGFYYLQIDFDPPSTPSTWKRSPSVTTTALSGRPDPRLRRASTRVIATNRRLSNQSIATSPPPAQTPIAVGSPFPDQSDMGTLASPPPQIQSPNSPSVAQTTVTPPPILRRRTSSAVDDVQAPVPGRVRSPSSKVKPSLGPPVLTGYYFHHQNSEPFQELSLRHVPQRGSGSFELR